MRYINVRYLLTYLLTFLLTYLLTYLLKELIQKRPNLNNSHFLIRLLYKDCY